MSKNPQIETKDTPKNKDTRVHARSSRRYDPTRPELARRLSRRGRPRKDDDDDDDGAVWRAAANSRSSGFATLSQIRITNRHVKGHVLLVLKAHTSGFWELRGERADGSTRSHSATRSTPSTDRDPERNDTDDVARVNALRFYSYARVRNHADGA